MCASRYWRSPRSGCASSCRQSKMRQSPRCAASSAVETSVLNAKLAMQPFVEVQFGIFHGRLVGAGVVHALLVERAAAAIKPLADLIVLERGLDVGGLLRIDELALEARDFFRIVELDHVGGARRRAGNQARDDEHVRIPLEGEPRKIARPERAVLGLTALEMAQALLVPALVHRRAGALEAGLGRDDLHRIFLAVVDAEVIAVREVAEARVERVHAVDLE